MPGSREDGFFRRFYRIPCVGFLPSVGNVSWITSACLKIAEQWFFYIICTSFRMRGLYRDKSYNALVVIGTTASDRSVLSCFPLILSRVCLLVQPHVSAFYTSSVIMMPYIIWKNKYYCSEIFSVHALQPSVRSNINFIRALHGCRKQP